MSELSIKFFSVCLNRPVSFKMYIPNDVSEYEKRENKYYQREMKTLFLLHGYTGTSNSWGIDDLGRKYNFAMVMPEGENAFWLDGMSTGHKYCSFVGRELVEYLRNTFGLCKSAEDTYICGMSMGGFGALHTGLAYPENFGKIGSMAAALIVHEISGMKPGEDNGTANYYYYHECFGNLDLVEDSEANPEMLVKAIKAENGVMPKIYMCCGTEDFLLENNRQFHSFLETEEVPHEYHESKGKHEDAFWNEYIGKIVDFMFAKQ